jgi:hypothetical protein
LEHYYQSNDEKRLITISKKCVVFTPENVRQYQKNTYACLKVIYSALKAANEKLKGKAKTETWTVILMVRVARPCNACMLGRSLMSHVCSSAGE